MSYPIKPWWRTMSNHRLHNHLTLKLKLPADMVTQITAQVREMRQTKRASKIKSTVVFTAWDVLLEPVRVELQNLRTTKNHIKKKTPFDQKRWDVVCAYYDSVFDLLERLKKVQKAGDHTPPQFVNFLRNELKRPVYADGTHWTDFVKQSEKMRIQEMYNALPPPARGRTKRPFERILPAKLSREGRARLVTQLVKAQQQAEQEYEVTTDPAEKKRLNDLLQDIHKASYVMDQYKHNAIYPTRWEHLLIGQVESKT